MKKLSIGSVELGKLPVVAAVIDRRVETDALAAVRKQGAALAELRFDLMGLDAAEALTYAMGIKLTGLFGIIGTCRETPENKAGRFDFFRTVLPAIDAIDLEIFRDINRPVMEMASGKTVIMSHHDFEKTPDDNALQSLVDQCAEQGPDIVKIAVTPRTNKDMDRFEAFIKRQKIPLIAIAMGPLGRDWRVKAFKAGSFLTYAFIGEKEVAPGQMPLAELSQKLSAAFPSFKKALRSQPS
jgi:3-dehydroquinate dehydratase-1